MSDAGGAAQPIAWFDRHPRAPILFLILLPFLAHLPQWLLRVHGDPIWQFSFLADGIHHSRWPGQPFLDPNVGFISQSFGGLIARDWLHGIVPWWNPYVGIGMPLAGEMQPGAFFLPFVLLLALPGGIAWLIIAMQIVAGLSTYALLRELSIGRLAAFVGGALFALNGTLAWVPGPAAVCCTLAFLPMLLLGIELGRAEAKGAAAILTLGSALAWSLFAGFPETAYLDGLLALSWAAFRIVAEPGRRLMIARRMLFGGLAGLLLAAPLLIAFTAELVASNMLHSHILGFSFHPLRALPILVMPAIYGPPNSGTANGSGMAAVWGSAGGYSTVLAIFFALLAFTNRGKETGLRMLLLAWTVLSVAKTFGMEPVMAAVNTVPFMKQVAFDRYSAPVWEFALIVLAALGLDSLRVRPKLLPALATTAVLIAACIALAWPAGTVKNWSSLRPHVQWLVFELSIFWALALTLLSAIALSRLKLRRARVTAAALLMLDAALMFCLPQTVGWAGGALDLAAVRWLQEHAQLSRVVTLGPLAPNYGAYFGFAELNYNISPVPGAWMEHVNKHLLPDFAKVDNGLTFWPVKSAPLDGDSAIRALNEHLADYQQLGVRYVVTRPGQSIRVAANGEMARAKLVVAGKAADLWELPHPRPYFDTNGMCTLAVSGREYLSSDCRQAATLVRNELFMPGWQAEVNNAQTQVRLHGAILQEISLPAGRSTIRFRFVPPYAGYGWLACLAGAIGLGAQIGRLRPPAGKRKADAAIGLLPPLK